MIATIRRLISSRSHEPNTPSLSLEAAIYLAAAVSIAGFGCYKTVTAATYLDAVKWSQAVPIVGQVVLVWMVARLTGRRARVLLVAITSANAVSLLMHITSRLGLFFGVIGDLHFLPLPWDNGNTHSHITFNPSRTLLDLSNVTILVWILYALWREYRRGEYLRALFTALVAFAVLAANLHDMFFVDSMFLAPYGFLLMLLVFWKCPDQTLRAAGGGHGYAEEAVDADSADRLQSSWRSWKSRFLPGDQNPLVGAALAMLLVSAAQLSASEMLENIVVLLVLVGMMQATIKTLYRVGSSRWLRKLAVVALCVLCLSQAVSILHAMTAYSTPFFLEAQGLLHPHMRNWLLVFGLLLLLSAFYLAGIEAGESRKALLLEHAQLVGEIAERKLMAEKLALVKESEQQRIRHDLHDTVGQDLAGLLCMAGGLSRKLKGVSEDGSKNAEAIEEGVRHTIEDVRKAIQGIAPIVADPKGLEVALVELVDKARAQHEIDVRFECQAPVSIIDYGAAAQLYRIAQEALTNAVKHAQARRINLSLFSDPQRYVLVIADDGIGIDAQKSSGSGMGLRTMRFRAAAIGATLGISGATAGSGTRIECVLRRQALSAE